MHLINLHTRMVYGPDPTLATTKMEVVRCLNAMVRPKETTIDNFFPFYLLQFVRKSHARTHGRSILNNIHIDTEFWYKLLLATPY